MKTFLGALATLAFVAASHAPADARIRLKQPLTATPADADASGLARLSLVSASEGKFEVKLRRLDRDAAYQLIVHDVRVADVVTSGSGTARLRFRTRPRSERDLALGFDPRGASILVRSAAGDDVLGTDFPDDQPDDDGDVVCCIPDDSGPECEDRTLEECTAQGGTVVAGATSCLPNPCEGAPPVGGDGDIVCCIPDDSGPECEDRTQAECLAEGGTVVEAISCTANPCAATPPAAQDIVCCLPDSGGDGANECEDRTADECAAAGGTVSSATSCVPDPCNTTPPPADEIACCVPAGVEGPECETLSPDACTAQGGTPASTGTCLPDPCGGSHSGGSGSSGPG
ncbi:MAG: hypothetical protein ACREQL_10870 [Candidatus Binatia bacterium]